MASISLIIFILSLAASFFFIFLKLKYKKESVLYYALPTIFLLVEALYVLPLAVRSALEIDLDPAISPYYLSFSAFLPLAVLMTAAFNIIFALNYNYINKKWVSVLDVKIKYAKNVSLIGVFALISISIFMISQLAGEVGGVLNLILMGYKVTEILSASSQYAIAFDWLVAASMATLYSGYATKDTRRIYTGMVLVALLIIVFAIMGRRAVLVVLAGGALAGYHISVKKISLLTLISIASILFLTLNFIGLTRGESYQDASQIFSIIADKGVVANEKEFGLFYTLTEGNFAVPFETFPQIIRTFGSEVQVGWGAYSIRGISFFIPSFLWEGRPDPLSVWYVNLFYGDAGKNIGRQFFILTAPYMDFGIAGVFSFGIFLAWFFRFIIGFYDARRGDPFWGTALVLFLGSMLNLVSNDLLGFMVFFFKSSGIPLIFLYFSTRFKWGRA